MTVDKSITRIAMMLLVGHCLAGCDDAGDVGPVGNNPYDNSPVITQENSAAPPRPRTGAQIERMQRGQPSQPSAPAQPSLQVEDVGAHALVLKFAEYSNMTRKATEMLKELTKIHIAVDESGDASPHQDRWGTVPADLTQLYTRVLETGYPPADVAEQLNERALPQFKSTLDATKRAMREHASVESGIDRSYADAESIYKHMSHNIADAE